jgi:hypothetical protein
MRAKLLLALCLSVAAFSQQKKILFMGEADMLQALQSVTDKAKIVPVTNANVMQELPDADAFIGTIKPEYVRADNVAALVKEGYGHRVLLSEDICTLKHLKYQGGKGYGYLLEIFVPMLRDRGITDEQIHQMLVTNPAEVFSRARRNDV